MNLKNHLLIAMPSNDAGDFHQSLVLVCDHNSRGAIGVIINKSAYMSLDNVFESLGIITDNQDFASVDVLMGGGIDQEHGLLIHSSEGQWSASMPITTNLSMTASADIISDIADGNGPDDFLFAMGYCSWDQGQLEDEIAHNHWLTHPCSASLLFEVDLKNRYKEALKQVGIEHLYQLSSDSDYV